MKKAFIALFITAGLSTSSYSLAAANTDANKEVFIDIIGDICQRQGFDAMILKQSGQTPEATQQHINQEVLTPLQKDIESIPNLDSSLSNTIIKLASAFSQTIITKAWEDDTNIIQEQIAHYGSTELTQAQQDAIWKEITDYSAEFSKDMGTMCQSQIYTILPSN